MPGDGNCANPPDATAFGAGSAPAETGLAVCSVRVMGPIIGPFPDVTSRFTRKADCGGGCLIGAPAETNHMCRPDVTVIYPTKIPLAQGVKFDN